MAGYLDSISMNEKLYLQESVYEHLEEIVEEQKKSRPK